MGEGGLKECAKFYIPPVESAFRDSSVSRELQNVRMSTTAIWSAFRDSSISRDRKVQFFSGH